MNPGLRYFQSIWNIFGVAGDEKAFLTRDPNKSQTTDISTHDFYDGTDACSNWKKCADTTGKLRETSTEWGLISTIFQNACPSACEETSSASGSDILDFAVGLVGRRKRESDQPLSTLYPRVKRETSCGVNDTACNQCKTCFSNIRNCLVVKGDMSRAYQDCAVDARAFCQTASEIAGQNLR